MTEVRPDAYIFDDGAHFEVRTVQEEDELVQSHETINELHQQSVCLRKVSIRSDDSDMFPMDAKTYIQTQTSAESAPAGVPAETTITKSTYMNAPLRQETTSTESKDTITPIEPSEARTLVGQEDDASTENIMELNFETARQKALRRRAMGRRNSESCSNYDLNRSQTSLNAALAMSRRQISLTQSEPDSDNALPSK